MNEPLPSKYTCSQCFTVAIIPADSAEYTAKCPNCSPTVPVKYTRGISLKPGAVAEAVATPGVFPTSIPLRPPVAGEVSDAVTIDKLTQSLTERDQQIATLQARVNELSVPAPRSPVQGLVPNSQPAEVVTPLVVVGTGNLMYGVPVADSSSAPVPVPAPLTDKEQTALLYKQGAPK